MAEPTPLPRTPYYNPTADYWPDLKFGRIILAPVGVGMNAKTGKIQVGWDSATACAYRIFATRYHERVLRRWVGSFVPHLLGESAVPHVITRFFWAIASALDLWEPRFKINRVRMQTRGVTEIGNPVGAMLTSADELRKGEATFAVEGVFRPRAHLGDNSPEKRRSIGLIGRGLGHGGQW